MRDFTNITALLRKDDNAVIVSTDAYVSHLKNSGPWRSSFSMNLEEALSLRDQLDKVIRDMEEANK